MIKAFFNKKYPNLGRVFKFVQPYKKLFYTSIWLTLFMAIVAPVRPYLIQVTVDKTIGNQINLPNWLDSFINLFNTNNLVSFITIITVFQIVLIIIETVARFSFSFITAKLGQLVVKDIRNHVYKNILKLPLSKFDTTPIGTLTTRTINDIESINEIFSDGLIPIIADVLTIFITVFTMFWIDWKLTLIALIPLPIIIIATYIFKETVKKSFTQVRNAVSALNAFVQEHLTGMQIVQAFTAEQRELDKFKTINKQHRDANIKAIFAYSVFFPVVELVLALSTALIVWFVANKALSVGENNIAFSGKIVAFVLFMNQIFRPLRVLADKFNVLQMGIIAAERVFAIANETKEKQATNIIAKNSISGNLEFKNVWFAYNNENYVLQNINFKVNKGETLAIIGSTGSGKTSIISLINKLYDIQKGEILIDETNINHLENSFIRQHIGFVLQDVFLFGGSIFDNITLRNPSITKEQVIEAAKLIDMHDFIMKLPNNYDYEVLERGATLSLGQRQLISFIRAILYNPAILVLDEATSSIDTESEQLIQQAIDKLIKNRTSIIIAHRLSTIEKANKVMVLQKGVIQFLGTYDEAKKLGYLH
ncbi:MAG: ABC transporter ATP-binding protein [Chitinophagaceae bacterium]